MKVATSKFVELYLKEITNLTLLKIHESSTVLNVITQISMNKETKAL